MPGNAADEDVASRLEGGDRLSQVVGIVVYDKAGRERCQGICLIVRKVSLIQHKTDDLPHLFGGVL